MRARFLALAVLVSCADGTPVDDPIDETLSGCDPLDDALCLLPFPSSYFLEASDTPTGWQVAYGETALPENRDFVQVRPDAWNEKDGYSINSPMLAWFGDIDDSGLIGHEDLEAYLDADALTVIVDLETGERVPHFAELDATSPDPEEALLMLRRTDQVAPARTRTVRTPSASVSLSASALKTCMSEPSSLPSSGSPPKANS